MKINYKKELETAAKNMILVRDPVVLNKMIVRMIVQKVRLRYAGILLYDKAKNTYVLTVSRGHLGIKVPAGFARMDTDNPLIRFFKERRAKDLFNSDALIYDEARKKIKGKLNAKSKKLLKNALYQMEIFHAVACVPSYFRDELMAIVLLGEKKNGKKFLIDELDFFAALSFDMAMAIRNARLFQDLQSELEKKYRLLIHTIISLAAAIEARDKYTHGHTARVTSLSLEIAKRIGRKNRHRVTRDFLELLHISGLLHDIGKIGVPDAILNKNGSLTRKEMKIMEEHPLLGSKILAPISELDDAILGVKHHHEKFDGSGYPDGLKAQQIPLIASIIAVADTFDAMTTNRPYRKALSKNRAIKEIARLSAKQFDPNVVSAFLEICHEGKV